MAALTELNAGLLSSPTLSSLQCKAPCDGRSICSVSSSKRRDVKSILQAKSLTFSAASSRQRRHRELLPCLCSAKSVAPIESRETEKHDKVKKSSETDNKLEEWMLENGMPPCKLKLQDRPGEGAHQKPIRYVVASEDLKPGDVALRVPSNLIVTLERVLGDETIAELLTTNQISELACLALYLMYEKKRGKDSEWYFFIRELDRQRGRGQLAVESPLLWTEAELEEFFAGSTMKEVVKERLEGIKREYQELDTVWFMAGSLFKQYPFDIPTEAFAFDIFKQAFVAIQASVVHLQGVSLARRFALVPMGPPLLSYKSTCRAMLKAKDGFVELEVDRPYGVGDPVYAWCGPQPNARLLLNYGIVDDDNPYDRLAVEISLDTSDPLYQNKRAIVQKNNRLTIQTFQLFRGKEMEGVIDMLPTLRLAHVMDPLEMETVSFAQGPICPTSPCNERAILDQLLRHVKKRLAAYRTTVEEDDQIVEDLTANPRKRVAAKLLRIEKKILMETQRVVQGFIDALPDGTVVPCASLYAPVLR